MNVKLGKEVGFSVPFQNCYNNDDTRIKYLTENMLLRELYYNPLVCSTSVQFSFQLSQYSVIIIDDAHERTVNTDLLLGILKVLRKHRPELRIIVMSASVYLQYSKRKKQQIEPQLFKNFFDTVAAKYDAKPIENGSKESTILGIQGRQYEVDVLYVLLEMVYGIAIQANQSPTISMLLPK